jgi:hypothetical protein
MNRNQKIALGCGGAGCLGLIVVALACVVLYVVYQRRPAAYTRNSNFNVNVNRGSNRNSDNDSAAATSSTMSEDDKHKLFQAASVAGDSALLQRVLKKLGLFTSAGSPSDKYTEFAKNHFVWALRNTEFIQSLDTPEKARAYVNEHIDD